MKLTLKEFFAGFLRTRHIARHFRRLALLESINDTTVSREVPPTLANTLVDAAHRDSGELLSSLGTHTDGLTDFEVDALRAQYGQRLAEERRTITELLGSPHARRALDDFQARRTEKP